MCYDHDIVQCLKEIVNTVVMREHIHNTTRKQQQDTHVVNTPPPHGKYTGNSKHVYKDRV